MQSTDQKRPVGFTDRLNVETEEKVQGNSRFRAMIGTRMGKGAVWVVLWKRWDAQC